MIGEKEILHLLVVEDDEDDYVITSRLLAVLPEVSCTLDWVTTYEAALDAAAHRRYDAYLVDYRLGALSGLELVKEMIARGSTAPIIVLTGESDRQVGMAAMAAGAADYLVKGEISAALLERSLRYARERMHLRDLRDRILVDAERARLRALIMEAPTAIALLRGPEYCVELANGAYIESVAHRAVLGRPLFELLPELVEQGVAELVDRVWATGEPFHGKEMALRLDYLGEDRQALRYFDMVYQPLRLANGTVEGILVHAVDVTERVLARRRLEQQARELAAQAEERAAIIEQMPSGVLVLDAAGRLVLINEVGRRISGHLPDAGFAPGEQTATYQLREVGTGRPLLLEETPPARALAGERVEAFEYLVHRPDRSDDIWISASAVPLRTADGAVRGAVSVFSDITGERRLGKALRLGEARLRAQFQGLPVPTYTWQRSGEEWILTDYNQAAERITDGGVEALLGITAGALYRETPDVLTGFAQCWASQMTVTREASYRFHTLDATRDLVISYVPVPPDLLVVHTLDITERNRAAAESRRHLDRLSGLRAVDLAITTSLDLRFTLGVVLEQVTAQLGVDAAQVLVLDEQTQLLECAAGRGFLGTAVGRLHLRLGQGHAGRAALECRVVRAPDLSLEDVTRVPLVAEERFVAYLAMPLVAKGQVRGVLEVFHRAALTHDEEWFAFLQTLAGQAAITIDNARLFTGLQRSNSSLVVAYDTTIEGWSRALDLRDHETEGHSQRVTEVTLRLARAMGSDDAELTQIRRGALLHDIGKMGVPDAILLKPGPLTEEEWLVMRKHPTFSYELLAPIAYLRPALDIPYCHHEKWDGTGYPQGMVGDRIPLAARIFAVVDVWDALTSDRPYRAAWPAEKARAHIQALAGTHFDPAVVHAFLQPGEQDGIGSLLGQSMESNGPR